jgi:CBS domain-containing protein
VRRSDGRRHPPLGGRRRRRCRDAVDRSAAGRPPGGGIAERVRCGRRAGHERLGCRRARPHRDGTVTGRPQAVVTPRDLAPLFGEQPANLLRQIRCAGSIDELRTLNQRARALTLQYLTTAAAVDWLGSLTHAIDVAIVGRILALNGVAQPRDCWCFAGSAGRTETLTLLAPQIVIVADDASDLRAARETHGVVLDALTRCGYLPGEHAFDTSFYVARTAEWKDRYSRWVRDPIMEQMYLARTLFDLRPVLGPRALGHDVESAVTSAVDSTFLFVLANDCLGRLPPLTFYEDAVVNQAGEHTSTFRLDQTALQPLVDVGRVVGIAGGAVFARSTIERFAIARTLLPLTNGSSGRRRRRCVWCSGSRGASASSRAPSAPSCRRRCSAGTTATCSRAASVRSAS